MQIERSMLAWIAVGALACGGSPTVTRTPPRAIASTAPSQASRTPAPADTHAADELLERAWASPSDAAFDAAWRALGAPALVPGVPGKRLRRRARTGHGRDPWVASVGRDDAIIFSVDPPAALRWLACDVASFLGPTILRCGDRFMRLPNGPSMRRELAMATARGDVVYVVSHEDPTKIHVLDLARGAERTPFSVPDEDGRRIIELAVTEDGETVLAEWAAISQDSIARDSAITIWHPAAPARPAHTFIVHPQLGNAVQLDWYPFALGPQGRVAARASPYVMLVDDKRHPPIEVSACGPALRFFFEGDGALDIVTTHGGLCVVDGETGALLRREPKANIEATPPDESPTAEEADRAWAAVERTLCSANGRPFPASFCRAHGVR